MKFTNTSQRLPVLFITGTHVFMTVCIIACGTANLQAAANDLHAISKVARASHQHESRHSHDSQHHDNAEATCEHALDTPIAIDSVKNTVVNLEHLTVLESPFGDTRSAVQPPTLLVSTARHWSAVFPLAVPLLI
jgi:hypothetical protein